MALENAADAFSALSNQYVSFRRRRQLWTAISVLTIISIVIAICLIFDFLHTLVPPRFYPRSIQQVQRRSPTCDSALGRNRLFGISAPPATTLCAIHDGSARFSSALPYAPSRLNFHVIGDWGRDGMCCQRDVAAEMAAVASRRPPSFIISTGDNFYSMGIQKVDSQQVSRSWRGVYIDPHRELQVPWKVVLGNHDHLGSIEAQMTLGKTDPYWHMKGNYYFETFGEVFIAFLDTTPLYYSEKEMEIFGGFDEMMLDGQIEALSSALKGSRQRIKIVVGHHPILSSGEHSISEGRNMKQLRTVLFHLLRDNNVTAYFCGHEHMMEHHILDGVNMFVSGAGSKLSSIHSVSNHTVFALDRQGFMEVSIRNDSDVVDISFIDLHGSVVHSAHIKAGPRFPSVEDRGRP